MPLDAETKRALLLAQKNEITEHHVYARLASALSGTPNADVLSRISADELRHYRVWREQTGEDVAPDGAKIRWYTFISRLLGLSFGLRLMEKGEGAAEEVYRGLARTLPAAGALADEEDAHERQLLGLIDEERLQYVGSMVLGLNDALVELTGTLAGLTFALQNTRLIAMAGLITGVAASLSMAASEYLSTKAEESGQNPAKASLYTGAAYVLAVALLILPYLLFTSFYAALALTIGNALLLILVFTYYISVAKGLPFKSRFLEMAGISLGVAAITFAIGYVVRIVLGVEV